MGGEREKRERDTGPELLPLLPLLPFDSSPPRERRRGAERRIEEEREGGERGEGGSCADSTHPRCSFVHRCCSRCLSGLVVGEEAPLILILQLEETRKVRGAVFFCLTGRGGDTSGRPFVCVDSHSELCACARQTCGPFSNTPSARVCVCACNLSSSWLPPADGLPGVADEC